MPNLTHPPIPEVWHIETECTCGKVAKWRLAFTVPGMRQSGVVYVCDEGRELRIEQLGSRLISSQLVRPA